MKEHTQVDTRIVEKAVQALLIHHEKVSSKKKSAALLGDELPVFLQIGLEKPARKEHSSACKPIRIKLPHSFHQIPNRESEDDLAEPEVCVIVKDGSKEKIESAVANHGLKVVKKVLDLHDLRTKHAKFQQRRQLISQYTHFMADDRILPMLPAALGRDYSSFRVLPLRLTRPNSWPFQILDNLASTTLTLSSGTCLTVQAGYTNMPTTSLVDNIKQMIPSCVSNIPKEWANVRMLSVKSSKSTALPLYHKTPEELLQIAQEYGMKPVYKLSQPETETEIKEDTKKRTFTKSPLLKALKKQKIEQKTSSETKRERKSVEKKDTMEAVTTESPRKEVTAKENIRKSSSEKKNDSKIASKKKESTKEKSPPKKKEVEPKMSGSNKDSARSLQDPPREPAATKSVESTKKADFIASKKFKGSQKGYIFRMDKSGLGYYKDVPPKVDPLALEAILRMGAPSRKGSGKKRRR